MPADDSTFSDRTAQPGEVSVTNLGLSPEAAPLTSPGGETEVVEPPVIAAAGSPPAPGTPPGDPPPAALAITLSAPPPDSVSEPSRSAPVPSVADVTPPRSALGAPKGRSGAPEAFADLPSEVWDRLDRVVNRFEDAWQRGERPSLADYLGQAGAERVALLRELVLIEVELRRRAGEPAALTDYHERFPELGDGSGVAAWLALAWQGPPDSEVGPSPSTRSQGSDVGPASANSLAETRAWQHQMITPRPTRYPTQAGPEALPRAVPPTADPSSEGSGPVRIPGYEILGELGRGGMGVIYKARHLSLNRVVALKMILDGSHAGTHERGRFKAEAEAVARLQHPGIVQIYEVGEHNGLPFFSLEFCPGGSLATKLHGTPLPAQEAARLTEALARGVQAAHEARVVHRDLKPANILLAGDGTPKLTDFGLAKKLDEAGQTRSGAIMGTPSYMAPEQASGKGAEVGPAADIYALGAILYEMLAARPPFKAATGLDTIMLVLRDEPVPPRRLQPAVPRDLETICLKCLEKEPHKRYPSALDLADDLHRFLNNEPIHARPVGACEQAWKWVKRRPAAAALVSVASLTLLVLFGLSLWFNAYLQDSVAEARADEQQARAEAEAAQQTQRLFATRAEIGELIRKGETAFAGGDYLSAQAHLANALGRAEGDPSLGALQVSARTSLDRARARARLEKARTVEETAQREARQREADFTERRFEAVYYGNLATGADWVAHRRRGEQAARKALELFAVTSDGKGAPVFSRHIRKDKVGEITDGCYELLLLRADLLAQPKPGQAPAEREAQVEQALRSLDRAADLGPLGPRPTRAWYLRRARYLTQLGRPGPAADARKRAEATRPVRALDHFLLGDEYYRQNQVPEAVQAFETTLHVQPDHFWARYFLAACYLKQKRWAEAELALSACLARRSDLPYAYALRGYANGELAALALRRLRPAGPAGRAEARAAFRFDAAEADFRQALTLGQKDTGAAYAALVNRGAMRLQRPGKWAEAVADFVQAIALRPGQYQAYLNLAQAYRQDRQWDKALAQLDAAVARATELPAVYWVRARLQVERSDLEAALRDCDLAVQLTRKQPAPQQQAQLVPLFTLRGQILTGLKRYQEALTAYSLALRNAPARPDPQIHRWCADLLLRLGRNEAAVAALDRYAKDGPPEASVHRDRGLALARLGRYSEALEDYTLALRLDPTDVTTYLRRGWHYALLVNAPRLARDDFEAAVRLKADGEAYHGLAYARVRLGQLPEALAAVEQGQKVGPVRDARLLALAARVYAQAAALTARKAGNERAALKQVRAYETAAVEFLTRAVEARPEAEQAAFW
jgi:tetratricopeptide (TPR) repeat protein